MLDAANKWISLISWWATADGVVIQNLAARLQATASWARILALVVDASLVLLAFAADHALWSAVWWSSNVSLDARAHSMSIGHSANTVSTARAWSTRINNGHS
jgi:hypothetical protein